MEGKLSKFLAIAHGSARFAGVSPAKEIFNRKERKGRKEMKGGLSPRNNIEANEVTLRRATGVNP